MCLTLSHPGDVKNLPRATQTKSKYCGRSSVVDGESSSDQWKDPLTGIGGGRRTEEGLGEG